MSPGADDPPVSKSRVNRVGARLRKAVLAGERLLPDDLETLDAFRRWHEATLELVHAEALDAFRGEALAITGRPLKTPQAIVAKLVRSRTRLSTMQDIAGTRITVPDLETQRAASDRVLELFADRGATIDRDTVEEADSYGYRAIHIVATFEGRNAEIQIRTQAQDAWAQLVEDLDRAMSSDMKHGQGPEDWLEWLILLSDALRERDLGHPVPLPPNPYDHVLERPDEPGE